MYRTRFSDGDTQWCVRSQFVDTDSNGEEVINDKFRQCVMSKRTVRNK